MFISHTSPGTTGSSDKPGTPGRPTLIIPASTPGKAGTPVTPVTPGEQQSLGNDDNNEKGKMDDNSAS